MRWRLAEKNAIKFFNVETVWDLDEMQLQLSYWIQFYAGIYEMSDDYRPADYIIENDVRLDEWIHNKEYLSKSHKDEYDDSNMGSYRPTKSFG